MKKRGLLIFIVIIILAITLGFLLQFKSNTLSASNTINNGTLLTQHIPINQFTLQNYDGKPFTKKNLLGKWSLLFFGFTHCPMICPTTLTQLSQTYHQLKNSKYKNLPQIIFISIDPQRDNPRSIRKYLDGFNKNFVGLTGSKEQLSKLTRQLGIVYMKATKSNEKKYTIEHSGSILVVNPKGELTAILSSPHNGKQIAEDFIKIQNIYRR